MRTILISAYGCEPLKGSEAGVGWNWVIQMAQHNRLHVITRANNQASIEAHLPNKLKNNIIFHYYDAPSFIRQLKKRAKRLYFYYFVWQIGIIPIVRHIIKTERIDYTMHLTFGSMWMPTFLPFFSTSFIWGPIGGGDCEPRPFLKLLPFKQKVIQSFRYVMNALSFMHPGVMFAAYRAKVILARTPNTARAIPNCFRAKVQTILETAMEDSVFEHKCVYQLNDDVVRMITTGRLLPNKNILTAVKSLGYIPKDYRVRLTIIGSGYQRREIEETAKRIGRSQDVVIIDELPREEVLAVVERSDIFLFPSLREGGSWSLMEAMAIGLPVICLDWAGMAIITDDNCAIRLPVSNPEQMPKDMAGAIITLIKNPGLREAMGKAGRNRIKEVYNWRTKGLFVEQLFNSLLHG